MMTDTTDSNTLGPNVPPITATDVAHDANSDVDVSDDAGETVKRWPNAALAQPCVVVGEQGVVPAGHAMALDWAIVAIAEALGQSIGRPLSLTGTTDVAAANQSDHNFGVVIQFKEPAIDALVSFDSTSTRALVNAMTSDLAGLIATTSPGPVASSTGTERGVAEYLSLLALDQTLKRTTLITPGPTIEGFLDSGQIEQWLGKHETRSVPLVLNASGSQGFVRVYVSGWTDQQWSPVFAIASQLGKESGEVDALDVHLALPAMSIQPEELASIEVGDVVLLGVSDLLSLSQRCALVTSTHWKVAAASIVEDTPTYVDVEVRPCTPTICDAAMDTTLIRPILGEANLPLNAIANHASLQLSKKTTAPVTLLAGPVAIARGELVILGRELAIRIVQIIST